jgi:hypothetical protein
MQPRPRFDEFTPEQLKRIDATWKSDMEKELADIRVIVMRLDEAFQQAQGALTFIKWAAGATTVIAGLWAWVSTHLTYK